MVCGPLRCALAVMFLMPLAATAAVQVKVVDVHTIITTDGPPPAESGKELRLAGARGGIVSGQVVVTSDVPMTALPVETGDLSGGGATIPRSAIQIRYPTVLNDLRRNAPPQKPGTRFDVLADALVPGQRIQPVFVTVDVPGDAKPGEYKGTLRVAGSAVPVRLTVSGFRIPRHNEDGILISIQQSPDAIAEAYDVPIYSDAHLKLLEPSYRMMAQLNNDVLYVPLMHKTWLGHRRGLVQFRRLGNTLVPDFGAFDRFMSMYTRICGVPEVMILNLWEGYLSWSKTNDKGEPINPKDDSPLPFARKMWVSVIEGNQLNEAEIDAYPANPDMWKAVVTGFRQRCEKLGVKGDRLFLGVSHDRQTMPDQVDFFRQFDPKMMWAVFTHGYGGPRAGYCGYFEFPDNGLTTDGLKMGWDTKALVLNTVRDKHNDNSSPIRFRQVIDISVDRRHKKPSAGFARLGLDQWGVVGRPEWRQLNPPNRLYRHATYAVTRPGPTHALPTQRYMMLVEGLHEAVARVAIEKAIVAGKLAFEGPVKELLLARSAFQKDNLAESDPFKQSPPADWIDQRAKLFDMADMK